MYVNSASSFKNNVAVQVGITCTRLAKKNENNTRAKHLKSQMVGGPETRELAIKFISMK